MRERIEENEVGSLEQILGADDPLLAPEPLRLKRENEEKQVRSITRTCRGPIVKQGDVEKNIPTEHAGCGFDVNNLLCAEPFDGKYRTAACPKCGVEHTFTTTPFE